MEEFETYYYDGVFYSKEEFEEMGLCEYSDMEFLNITEDKDKDLYDIITYFDNLENHKKSLRDYQEELTDKIFFKDCGDYGLVIRFRKYYGVRFLEQSLIFESDNERNMLINDVKHLVKEEFCKCGKDTYSIQKKYDEQKLILQKRKGLQEIIH